MVTNEMIKSVANEAGVKNKVAEEVLKAYAKVVLDTLKNDRDEKISLPGIGKFTVRHVPEKSGVTALADKKAWTKPAHDELKFTVSKSMKQF